MTRITSARVAGFTYLFYAAIGICIELLMHQARGVDGGAAELVRIGQHATNVRLSILIVVLECLSALVLGVTLYGITRVVDHELAVMGLVCRVAEGVLGALRIPSYLGLLWLAKPGGGTGAPDIPTTNALRTFLLMPVPSVPIGVDLLCRGKSDLFLASPARTDGARLNRMARRLRLRAARGGTAPSARRLPHGAAERLHPVAAGARVPDRARAVAAHQGCRDTGAGNRPDVAAVRKVAQTFFDSSAAASGAA